MITSPQDILREAQAKKQVIGSWGFNSHMDFTKSTAEQTNVWFFEQVFNFLRSFFGLIMPDNLEIITHNAEQHIKKGGLDQQTFLDELMLILKGLKTPIWTLRLNLNIVGFLRTHASLDQQVRIQIQEPSSLIIWGGPDESGFQNFSISYSLFSNGKLLGGDEMLWSVNQPLLEKALKKWERQTGRTIEKVATTGGKSAPKANRYGFSKPTPPAPPKTPTPSQA
jgi:hypothetical protein